MAAAVLTSTRRKQYTTKLKEWGYKKNVKDKDMAAIVLKDLKRKAEDPNRSSTFRLRGNPVPEQKIERYKSARGICEGSAFAANAGISNLPTQVVHASHMAVATPSDISCETPRPIGGSPMPILDPSPSPLSNYEPPNGERPSTILSYCDQRVLKPLTEFPRQRYRVCYGVYNGTPLYNLDHSYRNPYPRANYPA